MMDDNNLDRLIRFAAKLRSALDEYPDPRARAGNARALFDTAKAVFHDLVGSDALMLIYGIDPPASASANEQREALAGRLELLEDFFPIANKNALSSVTSARKAIEAISHGDSYRIFAPQPGPKGRRHNAYQLARCQLRALEWDAHLEAQGWDIPKRQTAIVEAFGATWTTIVRWDTTITRELEQGEFDRTIAEARLKEPFIRNWFEIDQISGDIIIKNPSFQEKLKIDGKLYQDELKRDL